MRLKGMDTEKGRHHRPVGASYVAVAPDMTRCHNCPYTPKTIMDSGRSAMTVPPDVVRSGSSRAPSRSLQPAADRLPDGGRLPVGVAGSDTLTVEVSAEPLRFSRNRLQYKTTGGLTALAGPVGAAQHLRTLPRRGHGHRRRGGTALTGCARNSPAAPRRAPKSLSPPACRAPTATTCRAPAPTTTPAADFSLYELADHRAAVKGAVQ